MKKLLCLILFISFLIGSTTFASSTLTYDEIQQEYRLNQIQIKKEELQKKYSQGSLYVLAIDGFIEKYKDDTAKIKKLLHRTYQASAQMGKKKNAEKFLLILEYIEYKAQYILLSSPDNDTKNQEKIIVTFIDDSRCTDCPTDQIIEQVKDLPFLSDATIVRKDFSDSGVSQYMKENNIKTIPAAIFSTNNIKEDGGQIIPYLTQLSDGQYSLMLPKTFDPFLKRSDKGFVILDTSTLKKVLEGSYTQGKSNAKLTWIEYSDLECPYCAKLHNDGTSSGILKKYSDDINITLHHFPLDFHKNAKPAAVILECVGELSGAGNFYSLVETVFSNKNSNSLFIIQEAEKLGVNKTKIQSCIDEEKYFDKISLQQKQGQDIFGITGTPGNVIINNKTGEYEVISGAYPISTFEAVIDRMLAK